MARICSGSYAHSGLIHGHRADWSLGLWWCARHHARPFSPPDCTRSLVYSATMFIDSLLRWVHDLLEIGVVGLLGDFDAEGLAEEAN